MLTLFIVLLIITGSLLILIVLMQNKSGGLSSTFGGGGSMSQFMGVKKTGDFLEKATWVLVALLLLLSLGANMVHKNDLKNKGNSILSSPGGKGGEEESAQEGPVEEDTAGAIEGEDSGSANIKIAPDSTQ